MKKKKEKKIDEKQAALEKFELKKLTTEEHNKIRIKIYKYTIP